MGLLIASIFSAGCVGKPSGKPPAITTTPPTPPVELETMSDTDINIMEAELSELEDFISELENESIDISELII